MRYVVTTLTMVTMVMMGAVLTANAQRVGLETFDALAEQAGSKIQFDLPQSMLAFAVPFLGEDDLNGIAHDLVQRIEGVYVRVLEDVDYSGDQLGGVERQLEADNWNRLVNIDEGPDGDQVGVWLYREEETITGVFVLVAEPDEIVAVNMVGELDPTDLAMLGEQFGIGFPNPNP